MSGLPHTLRERAAATRLLILDVDGVLTDGRLHYGPDGEQLKVFHVKDGLGLRLLMDEGVEVAVISARRAPALERRLKELRVERAQLGRGDKLAALHELLGELEVDASEVAFMGDDVLDLPVMRAVGLGITPADGHPLVRAEADWVTLGEGGRGAVREVADALLDARGRLEGAVEDHLARRAGAKPSSGA
ncbi:MAG TPA: HAD-IIIA family hydrolase [Polyangiaceae bacterium LLY-WYZ-15_(1-7)]|nr:phenylphosphate carboxylase subunit delta [Myxococcales bacterium]MAT25614.1 phenylphosphate carboxylase subunit delta [Sandaracinus sp.]HJK91503.1 HAD-IIIA family hydrolase [Polyangiaceae bacterium LLY-WYZ-15_(1-7)]MBJ73859.1 phenylphosphate carboxylase subunit delta [Sandaracinus sp.]HJL01797.1 HAD-IIIA family hydrolase [Polyangiaceae bacterium LLY-WYZ-15_(1-7)]